MGARSTKLSATGTFGAAFALAVLMVLANPVQANAAGSVQPAVGLGTVDDYGVLAGTTVTNTGATTINNGDLGLSPGTSITGFPPGVINNGVVHATDAQALQAQADLTTAYNDAAGRTPDESGIIDLAGRTIEPGVYSGGAVALNGTVTLSGSANSVFIFQAASTLITSSASAVTFTGGASSCNVFWQVGSSATLGSGSTFAGTIMALTSITAQTSATVEGRLLARNGAVTLDTNVIDRPATCAPRGAIVDSTPTADQAAADAAAAAAAARAEAEAAAAAAAEELRLLAATGTDQAVPLVIAGSLTAFGMLLLLAAKRRSSHMSGARQRS